MELGYGSGLDLVFVHNSVGVSSETKGIKKIYNDTLFTRLVQRIIHLLTTVTSTGKVFDIGVRLRPYGQSGPIVSTITSYENYLRNEAWLRELHALIRARPVTNSPKLFEDFVKLRQAVLCQPRNIEEVRTSLIEMREEILAEHGSKDRSKFNIKKDNYYHLDVIEYPDTNIFIGLAPYTDNTIQNSYICLLFSHDGLEWTHCGKIMDYQLILLLMKHGIFQRKNITKS